MHDIKWIRNNPELFDELLGKRGIKPTAKKIIEIDEQYRKNITELQELNTNRNELAKKMGNIFDKKSGEFEHAKLKASKLKEEIAIIEKKIEVNEVQNLLETIPNLPASDVIVGRDEEENIEIKKWGKIKEFNFKPREHTEIGEKLDELDFEVAAKISGSRFVILKKDFAKLERALINFMLDIHTEKFGYEEISAPVLVKDHAMYGVGQLPKFADESFATINGYRLIPTTEVTLTNLVADKILDPELLPLRYTGYSLCFRSEAGSAGRDTHGMIRLHQFPKVELVSITLPEKSEEEHIRMLESAEYILQLLDIPYRVMMLCTGDMGFAAKKTYDIEVWLPSQNKYREISSCSNCGDFQARRMKARYTNNEGANKYVHTLNGSALAVGRTMVAIIENYQQEDGSIIIPDILRSYMNGKTIIKPYLREKKI